MRFKPPPANSPIGWRVEFRPTEVWYCWSFIVIFNFCSVFLLNFIKYFLLQFDEKGKGFHVICSEIVLRVLKLRSTDLMTYTSHTF